MRLTSKSNRWNSGTSSVVGPGSRAAVCVLLQSGRLEVQVTAQPFCGRATKHCKKKPQGRCREDMPAPWLTDSWLASLHKLERNKLAPTWHHQCLKRYLLCSVDQQAAG